MTKQKILSIINISVGFFFFVNLYLLIQSTPADSSFLTGNFYDGMKQFFSYYGINMVFISFSILNFLIGSWVFLKDIKNAMRVQAVSLLLIPYWICWVITTAMVPSTFLLLIPIVLSLIIFRIVRKKRKKLALLLSLLFLGINLLAFVSGFESSYCWYQGQIADPTGSKMMPVPNDGVLPYAPGIEEHDTVGIAYYADLKCHKNFNFKNALLDSFNFRFVRI